LARLFGEVYRAPVDRWRSALPLAVEGTNRESDIVVNQLHLKPVRGDAELASEAVPHAYKWDWRVPLDPGDRIVLIIRDVRDVIVSAHFYWQRETLLESVDAVTLGQHPLQVHGPWARWVGDWLSVLPESADCVTVVKYEQLNRDPVGVLRLLVGALQIPGAPELAKSDVEAAVAAQSFDAKVKQIEDDGDDRPYGKTIQLRNLRKGVVGDWRNHFTQSLAQLVESRAGGVLRELGYDAAPLWWKSV
jgi:hypothetical protein